MGHLARRSSECSMLIGLSHVCRRPTLRHLAIQSCIIVRVLVIWDAVFSFRVMKKCSVGLFLILFIEDLQVSFYNLFILYTLHLFNGVVKSCLFLLKVYTENCKYVIKLVQNLTMKCKKIALSSGCTPKSPLGFTEEP